MKMSSSGRSNDELEAQVSPITAPNRETTSVSGFLKEKPKKNLSDQMTEKVSQGRKSLYWTASQQKKYVSFLE